MQAGTMQPAKLPAYMQLKRMCVLNQLTHATHIGSKACAVRSHTRPAKSNVVVCRATKACVLTCALLTRGVRALLLLCRLASVASTVAYVRLAVVAKEQQ
jgi:hypothetical protein